MSEPNIRPLNDVVLVKVDEAEARSDIIIDPNKENAPLRKGTVIRTGPGRWKLIHRNRPDKKYFRKMEAKPGDRIVFFAAALGAKQGRQLAYSLPDGYGMLREEDILFAYDGDVRVDL